MTLGRDLTHGLHNRIVNLSRVMLLRDYLPNGKGEHPRDHPDRFWIKVGSKEEVSVVVIPRLLTALVSERVRSFGHSLGNLDFLSRKHSYSPSVLEVAVRSLGRQGEFNNSVVVLPIH